MYNIYMYVYVYIYSYIHIHIYIHIYLYINITPTHSHTLAQVGQLQNSAAETSQTFAMLQARRKEQLMLNVARRIGCRHTYYCLFQGTRLACR